MLRYARTAFKKFSLNKKVPLNFLSKKKLHECSFQKNIWRTIICSSFRLIRLIFFFRVLCALLTPCDHWQLPCAHENRVCFFFFCSMVGTSVSLQYIVINFRYSQIRTANVKIFFKTTKIIVKLFQRNILMSFVFICLFINNLRIFSAKQSIPDKFSFVYSRSTLS